MSNANAVSILTKLASYYDLEADLTDSHGANDIATGVVSSFEAGGKFGGNRLAAGSRGAVTIASSIAITASTGQMFVGGWIYYTGSTPARADFGLSLDYNNNNEQLTIDGSSGKFAVIGWEATPPAAYSATDPNTAGIAYDFTVQVQDSLGDTATSDQQIIIRDAGAPYATGWYFVVGQYDLGVPKLWVSGNLVNTGTQAASVRGSPVAKFQIGNQFGPANCVGALNGLFFGGGGVLTQDEITYLYNAGAGKSYADIVADAA